MHGLAFAPMGNGSFPTIKLAQTASDAMVADDR